MFPRKRLWARELHAEGLSENPPERWTYEEVRREGPGRGMSGPAMQLQWRPQVTRQGAWAGVALQRQGGQAFVSPGKPVNGCGLPSQREGNLGRVSSMGQKTIPVKGTAVSLQQAPFPAAWVEWVVPEDDRAWTEHHSIHCNWCPPICLGIYAK